VAWWIWALGLAAAASRTTNPLLLLVVFAVLGLTVANRRTDAPWARAFKYYVYLAGIVVVMRLVFRSIFGGDVEAQGMHVLFRLPSLPLPSWAAGVQVGGAVTLEGTLGALYGAMQLGCLIACIGAANALANPKRALRVLPGALYELGAAVVVCLSVGPQLIESIQRVRRARRLRGDTAGGRSALRTVAIPVLEDALDRSLHLAASMDARGYGRPGSTARSSRRITGILVLAGMVGLCASLYEVLGGSTLGPAAYPCLAASAGLCVAGMLLGGRRTKRSPYRPDPWKAPEWAVAACGVIPAVVLLAGLGHDAGALNPSVSPPQWPGLPLLPLMAVLVGLVAAVAAPPPPRPVGAPGAPAARRKGRLPVRSRSEALA
jgi:energy-coupling factor transport system permease protein